MNSYSFDVYNFIFKKIFYISFVLLYVYNNACLLIS